VRRGSKLKEVEKTDEAIYIPILSSLQQLLNDESIWEEVNLAFVNSFDCYHDSLVFNLI
jgi:hypothetical protein